MRGRNIYVSIGLMVRVSRDIRIGIVGQEQYIGFYHGPL